MELGARFHDPGPSDHELELMGIRREDLGKPPDFEVWPENWEPYLIYREVFDQWVMGSGGPVGINNLAIKWQMELHGVKKSRQREILMAVRTIASAGISQIATNMKQS